MFQERNRKLQLPNKDGEYFFDRNSKAFHYVMEFYRTGKILWPGEIEDQESKMTKLVTTQQLEQELEYFQIPFNNVNASLIYKSAGNSIDELIIQMISFRKFR